MKLLLDTHAYVWFVVDDPRLSKKARRRIEAVDTVLYLSAASVWELAIKTSLGRFKVDGSFRDYIEERFMSGIRPLAIDWTHGAAVADLPWHHKDPFDRLIIAQSLVEKMPVVSGDPLFKAYGVDLIW